MRRHIVSFVTMVIILGSYAKISSAYWIWTPQTGKFINPKYAVKETPQKQFDWAMTFFEAEDYKKAIAEFEKLIKHYPLSKLAASSQFHLAWAQENTGDYYKAFKSYQLVIDKYPYSERVDEIIERQYRIGNLFYSGQKAKLLGVPILPAKKQAIEIFSAVVENAPYGKYAPYAQYKLGECYMEIEDYINAALAFKKIIESYPKSPLVDDAKYQIAMCAANSTSGPEYNEEDTDKAIKEFKDFVRRYPDSQMEKEAHQLIDKLEDQKAQNQFNIARFYEKQKNLDSAIIYYEEILDKYPQSEWAVKALERVQIIRKEMEK
ncbi:MAG: outer membrane protein assembly factor BamD [Candidatus Omnitrophota bacterium]|nr:MAG: outer membrane protein assembly factor BamD [Candidatus Omnitrophota bacterium]